MNVFKGEYHKSENDGDSVVKVGLPKKDHSTHKFIDA